MLILRFLNHLKVRGMTAANRALAAYVDWRRLTDLDVALAWTGFAFLVLILNGIFRATPRPALVATMKAPPFPPRDSAKLRHEQVKRMSARPDAWAAQLHQRTNQMALAMHGSVHDLVGRPGLGVARRNLTPASALAFSLLSVVHRAPFTLMALGLGWLRARGVPAVRRALAAYDNLRRISHLDIAVAWIGLVLLLSIMNRGLPSAPPADL
jgi:hypothetical protein